MDCIVHGVKKSQTELSDFHFQTYGKSYKEMVYTIMKEKQTESKLEMYSSVEDVNARPKHLGDTFLLF